MKLQSPAALTAMTVVVLLTGCATKTETTEQKEDSSRVAAEAPLGSRIKKRTNVAPVTGATRQDIENAKVQQGIHQAGVVNRTGS